ISTETDSPISCSTTGAARGRPSRSGSTAERSRSPAGRSSRPRRLRPSRPRPSPERALRGSLVDEHALALVEAHADLAGARGALDGAGAELRVRDAISGAVAVDDVVGAYRPRRVGFDDLHDGLRSQARSRLGLRLHAARAGLPRRQQARVAREGGTVLAIR